MGAIESLVTSLVQGSEGPSSVYLSSLEKLGLLVENLCSFYHASHEFGYSGLKSILERVLPPQIVILALRAIAGQSYGLSEAKASLRLVTVLLNSSVFSDQILEAGGLQHLLVLITSLHSSSQIQVKVMEALKSLISTSQNANKFIEDDFIASLDPKIVSTYFSITKLKPKEPVKKQKNDEDERYRTGLEVLQGLKTEKRAMKLASAKKSLMHKISFYQQLRKFQTLSLDSEVSDSNTITEVVEVIRRDLKMLILKSSTNSFVGLKQDLKNFLILDSTSNFENLRSISQLISQPVLSNCLANWLASTNFLANLLKVLQDQRHRTNLESFRTTFISIVDILLVILRSQGGIWFLNSQPNIVQDFANAFRDIEIPDCLEDAELSLVEEEYLLSAIQLEKLPSYALQMSFVLNAALKLCEQIYQMFYLDSAKGLSDLYKLLNAVDQKYLGFYKQIFYTIVKTQPEIFLYLLEMIDLTEGVGLIRTFYILEIAHSLMIEDRSGEISIQVGPEASDLLANLMDSDCLDETRKMIDLLQDWLRPIKKFKEEFSIEKLIEDLANYGKVKADNLENEIKYSVLFETKDFEVEIRAYGLMNQRGSSIIQLMQILRMLNTVLSVKK